MSDERAIQNRKISGQPSYAINQRGTILSEDNALKTDKSEVGEILTTTLVNVVKNIGNNQVKVNDTSQYIGY